MAKRVDLKKLVHFELERLEEKVKEFQDYLQVNSITAKVTSGNEVVLSEDNQDKLHKEIVIQIKMQDALFSWIPLLEKLRETEDSKQLETRGDIEVNGMFKQNKDK